MTNHKNDQNANRWLVYFLAVSVALLVLWLARIFLFSPS